MYYILLTNDGERLSNDFVYDSDDGSVEYVTKDELKSYVKKIDLEVGVIESDDALIAKVLITYKGFYTLFNNGHLKFSFQFSERNWKGWHLVLYCFDKNITFGSFVSRSDLMFDWHSYFDYAVYARVPEYYVGYLISNKDARDRELHKILCKTSFTIINTNGIPSWISGDSLLKLLADKDN